MWLPSLQELLPHRVSVAWKKPNHSSWVFGGLLELSAFLADFRISKLLEIIVEHGQDRKSQGTLEISKGPN